MRTVTAQRTLDRRGKTITTFVVYDAATELEGMAEGDVLEILTDDFDPFRSDIDAWCRSVGHRMVDTESIRDGLRFLVEKGHGRAKGTKLAMVISNAGLEELLSPLGFALAAALEGIDVHVYFQGPAVRVLRRGYQPRMGGWARPITRFAAAGMAKSGHIAAQDKLGQLRNLGAHIYLCGPSMQRFKVDRDDLIFDDVPLVEYLTFMAIMDEADTTIYA